MAKKSFGNIVKERTYQLLAAVIRLANFEIDDGDDFKIKFRQKTEQIFIIETKIQNLVYLTRTCGYQLTRDHIKESLQRLKDLAILEDHRLNLKGSHLWRFSLKLWYPFKHKNLNLDRFNREWYQFKSQLKDSIIITPKHYHAQGIQRYDEGNLVQAFQCFQKAINLDNNYADAHYHLGLIYEYLQDYEQASHEYRQAILGGLCSAYNNLGRLLILQEKYNQAVNLLLKGLEKAQLTQEKFTLYKNLGWARFLQKRHQEAEVYLLKALEIDPIKGSVYGLLAQTWEALEEAEKAQSAYQNCIRYASIYQPEEDEWLHVARKKCQ